MLKIGITGDIHGEATFSKIFKAKKLGYTHIIVCADYSAHLKVAGSIVQVRHHLEVG